MKALQKIFDRTHHHLRFKYHGIRMSKPIWRFVTNKKGRALFKKNPQNLDSIQQKILGDLEKNGIAFAHITDIISADEWQELQHYLKTRLEDDAISKQLHASRQYVHGGEEKYYNIDLFDQTTIDLEHPTTKWALNEKILGIAAAYMDMYVRFRGARLWVSLPVPEGAKAYASQRWHRDLDDRQLMKTFIYFDDVDETAGPFHYIRESHAAGRWGHLFPTPFPLGSYPPDGAVDKAIPKEYVVRATGKAGTLIFCDTSGFHKGGYCTKRNRYMLFNLYTSNASKHEKLAYRYPPQFNTKGLSPLATYAITNEGMKVSDK